MNLQTHYRMALPTGETYEGNFQDELYQGVGVFHFLNGSIYEGQWHQGMRQGHGLMRYTVKSHQASIEAYNAIQALTPRQKLAKKNERPPLPFTTPLQPRLLTSAVDPLDYR